MKILGLSCSPHKDGNTVGLLKIVLQGAKEEGADTELFSVAGKNIQPCMACMSCAETGECKIKDDMQELYEKMLEADGIVFATPLYFYNMTAQAKAIIDRTFAFGRTGKTLRNKVGGVVATAGSFGSVSAVKDFYFYMVTQQIIPANYVAAYTVPNGIEDLEKCKQAAVLLGQQMVRIAKQGFQYPADISRSSFAYGTHTK